MDHSKSLDKNGATAEISESLGLLIRTQREQQKMMIIGTVFDIKKFSLHDGPGIRTTVFLKGCPLTCWWCHNPESLSIKPEMLYRKNRCIRCGACVEVCEQGAIVRTQSAPNSDSERCVRCGACVEVCYAEARQLIGHNMPVAQVMAEIRKDIPFYEESGGGATFSGGEPLGQPEFLRSLLQACKKANIHTALDTSGFAAWEVVDSVRKDVDLFLYDLKLMDEAGHQACTGVSNRIILDNLRKLSERGHRIFLRLPLIPGVNDDDGHIRRMITLAISLPHLERVDLLPYHHLATEKYTRLGKIYHTPETNSLSPKRLNHIANMLEEAGLRIKVGG